MRIVSHIAVGVGSLCLLSASPAGVGEIDPLRDSLGDGRRLAIIAKAVGMEEGISVVSNNALGIVYDANAVQACVDRLYPSGWPYTD